MPLRDIWVLRNLHDPVLEVTTIGLPTKIERVFGNIPGAIGCELIFGDSTSAENYKTLKGLDCLIERTTMGKLD